jgi:heavy metal sensor kinase
MFDSVRTRLMFWYAGVLALSLIAFAVLLYYVTANIFRERLDESLHSTAQTVASAYLEELAEQQSAGKASQVVLAELLFPDRYVEITDKNGHATGWSRNFEGHLISIPASALNDARRDGRSFAVVNNMRVAVVPLTSNQDPGFATVAEPRTVVEGSLTRLRRNLYAGVPLVLLLTSAGGYFLARKSLSPIASMNKQTQVITAQNLSSRLNVPNPRDELGGLATTINELLTRLEVSFRQQQQFIADASHELRTPLAVLRSETEVALGQKRSADEYEESLLLIKDEAERLSRIVEDLFILANQPSQMPAVVMKEPVVLNELVHDCVRAARVLGARKDLNLKLENTSTALSLNGDDELLRRMLLNLLDNAIKYTPDGGEIFVELQRQNGNARLIVRDTGIGISATEQSHVFDRFYRVDKARSRSLGGAGLGLSIVNWIVEAHQGKITLESTLDHGSKFTVELPLERGTSPET